MTMLVALMACHNRRDKTLASIERLFACEQPQGLLLKLVLVDDGSTDGTADAVRARFPHVVIEQGDGSLFWNRGMLRAWQRALPLAPDFVLWLNDDTILYPNALTRLLQTEAWIRSSTGQCGIVVGSTENDAGQLSYGGAVSVSPINRLKMRLLVPSDVPQPVAAMNGNCVLVPRVVSERIGVLDGIYRHSMGDHDYGFRARKAGFGIWVIPGYAGRCNNDRATSGSFDDRNLPLRTRWNKLNSAKGLPAASWRTLCRRHAGPAWPLVWLSPYARLLAGAWARSESR